MSAYELGAWVAVRVSPVTLVKKGSRVESRLQEAARLGCGMTGTTDVERSENRSWSSPGQVLWMQCDE
jgi:hypothetical protein